MTIKRSSIITIVSGSVMLLAPAFVFAATNFTDLTTLFKGVTTFIGGTLVPLVFTLAFIVFIWGVAKYFIFSGASEEGKEQGRQLMIWGIIGFFVMVAVWGIVNLLVTSTNLGGKELENLPKVPVIK